ncbi:hypothetical protein HPB51_026323 [Rhipicephalus microplus]|uniref:Uncharacterized protein n=1 Tax=Rhipicephalus microplus TaxID=6941 RepID=A0A9J6D3E0_RHIMP|nr:hypothetical protein HPB51_026323 [Rhipicephalus microplus]
MCGDSHLTGVADCGDNYWNPIKPTMSPSNAKRKPTPKKTPSFTVNTKKRSFAPGIPGQVKTTNKADIRRRRQASTPEISILANAQTKASGWVGGCLWSSLPLPYRSRPCYACESTANVRASEKGNLCQRPARVARLTRSTTQRRLSGVHVQ